MVYQQGYHQFTHIEWIARGTDVEYIDTSYHDAHICRGSGRGGTWFISRGITSSPILNGLPGGPMSSILIPPITMLNNHNEQQQQ